MMEEGGYLYISVPIEPRGKTYFNAYRSFAESELLALFKMFTVLDKIFIYGSTLSTEKKDQLGFGCYHLNKNPIPKGTPQAQNSSAGRGKAVLPTQAGARELPKAA